MSSKPKTTTEIVSLSGEESDALEARWTQALSRLRASATRLRSSGFEQSADDLTLLITYATYKEKLVRKLGGGSSGLETSVKTPRAYRKMEGELPKEPISESPILRRGRGRPPGKANGKVTVKRKRG